MNLQNLARLEDRSWGDTTPDGMQSSWRDRVATLLATLGVIGVVYLYSAF